jgi:hypothetical protein
MKTCGRGDITLPFLSLELDEGEWSASHPSCFTAGDSAPTTHWLGGWVGPGGIPASIASISAFIQTKHLLNTKVEHYW